MRIPFRSTVFVKIRIAFLSACFALFSFLLSSMCFAASHSERVGPWWFFALYAVFVLALLWWVLVLCINGADIALSGSQVTTTYGPLPSLLRRHGPHPIHTLSELRVEPRVPAPRGMSWPVFGPILIRALIPLLAAPYVWRIGREPLWRIMATDEEGKRVCVADWIATKEGAERLLRELNGTNPTESTPR